MSIFAPIIEYLHTLSETLPLPIFVSAGAAIEEIVAPIPSPLVMTLGGSLSASLDKGALYLVYFISDRAEDLVLNKFGRFLGVSHKEVERMGSQLSGGIKDDLVMLALRAIPIIPTAPVSIISGLLKINLVTFLWTTFVGYTIRNYFYLYLGSTSVSALESLNSGLDSVEKIGYLILFLLMLFITYLFYKQRKDENILVKLLRFLKLK